jgi:hypothetical protein
MHSVFCLLGQAFTNTIDYVINYIMEKPGLPGSYQTPIEVNIDSSLLRELEAIGTSVDNPTMNHLINDILARGIDAYVQSSDDKALRERLELVHAQQAEIDEETADIEDRAEWRM